MNITSATETPTPLRQALAEHRRVYLTLTEQSRTGYNRYYIALVAADDGTIRDITAEMQRELRELIFDGHTIRFNGPDKRKDREFVAAVLGHHLGFPVEVEMF